MATRTRTSTPLVRPSNPLLYAQCRSMGHEWRHKGTVGVDEHRPFNLTDSAGFVSQCADCKARRVKWITRSGEVISRYEYPDGYSMHGDERLTTRQWRAAFVVSVFGGAS